MKHLLQSLIFLYLAVSGQLLTAQPAIYENSVFTIPHGAALVDGVATYYTNIQLETTSAGTFMLTAAQESNLVMVDTVVANVAESLPVQVSLTVAGQKSVPCVSLESPAIFRDEFAFTVVLAETTLGPAESCIAIVDPFETTIPLDVSGLDSGTYTVSVNGVEASFNL